VRAPRACERDACARRDGQNPCPGATSIVQPIGRSAPQSRSRSHTPEARSVGGR
jgi:hypothetical protein